MFSILISLDVARFDHTSKLSIKSNELKCVPPLSVNIGEALVDRREAFE